MCCCSFRRAGSCWSRGESAGELSQRGPAEELAVSGVLAVTSRGDLDGCVESCAERPSSVCPVPLATTVVVSTAMGRSGSGLSGTSAGPDAAGGPSPEPSASGCKASRRCCNAACTSGPSSAPRSSRTPRPVTYARPGAGTRAVCAINQVWAFRRWVRISSETASWARWSSVTPGQWALTRSGSRVTYTSSPSIRMKRTGTSRCSSHPRPADVAGAAS